MGQLVQYLHNMTKPYIWFPELHKLGMAVQAILAELGMAVQAILAELGMMVLAILAELGVVVFAVLALKMWKQHD